jgi:lysozyme family protein
MVNFDTAVNYVLANEGGLVCSTNDPGGLTNRGISLRFLLNLSPERLKSYGLPIDHDALKDALTNMSLETTKSIYQCEFWNNAPFDKLINQDYVNYIFDMAVNMGIAPAVKCVQRAIWAVTKRYDLIPDDGILGNQTISLIQRCGFLLAPALRAERAAHYRDLALTHPNDKEFLNGWLKRTYRD